jgi:tetratricopeptide (TPR) repeat protein
MNFYTNYAGFVYAFVSFQLDPAAGVSPRSLNLDLTSSSFLLYLQSRINYESGKVREAAHWLDRRPRGANYTEFYHLYYLQGKILLGLEPSRAADLLKKYLDNHPSDIYRKSAWRYLSWYHLLAGEPARAAELRIKVLTEGTENTGADRQAALEARRPWNETLIRARVLFDAARYDSAGAVLPNSPPEICCPEARDKLEYFYRQGRVLQKQGDLPLAASAFEKALDSENVPDCYELGNSALQLALMAEERRNRWLQPACDRRRAHDCCQHAG